MASSQSFPLTGSVEVDETYIGGRRPGKRDRGAEGKALVAVAVVIAVVLVRRRGGSKQQQLPPSSSNAGLDLNVFPAPVEGFEMTTMNSTIAIE